MSEQELDWPAFLAELHRTRPGVAEAALSRASSGDHSPYRWLARAVSADATTVLDLACGSGPMSRLLAQPGRTVVGLDLSAEELALAAERGPGPWVRGDALALPFRDGSVDVVTSSLGLVVVTPLADVLREVVRVLRPGGCWRRSRPPSGRWPRATCGCWAGSAAGCGPVRGSRDRWRRPAPRPRWRRRG